MSDILYSGQAPCQSCGDTMPIGDLIKGRCLACLELEERGQDTSKIPPFDYFDAMEREVLSCETLYEAVEEVLDDLERDDWPDEIEVRCFDLIDVTGELRPDRFINDALEYLDENFGDPNGALDDVEVTDEMRKVAETFCRAMERLYSPWRCEHVHTITVNVMEWVRENEPEWLEETNETE